MMIQVKFSHKFTKKSLALHPFMAYLFTFAPEI